MSNNNLLNVYTAKFPVILGPAGKEKWTLQGPIQAFIFFHILSCSCSRQIHTLSQVGKALIEVSSSLMSVCALLFAFSKHCIAKRTRGSHGSWPGWAATWSCCACPGQLQDSCSWLWACMGRPSGRAPWRVGIKTIRESRHSGRKAPCSPDSLAPAVGSFSWCSEKGSTLHLLPGPRSFWTEAHLGRVSFETFGSGLWSIGGSPAPYP